VISYKDLQPRLRSEIIRQSPRRVPCGSGSWGILVNCRPPRRVLSRSRGLRVFFTYSDQLRIDIETRLSPDRLSPFRSAVDGDVARAIDLYCWNAAVGSAFFGPIGVLEVLLRNALYRELCAVFSTPWHDDPSFLAIDRNFPGKVDDAKREIRRRGGSITEPRIVAELSFGFWVNLLRPGPNGAYVRNLWGPALSRAFPRRVRRSQVSGALDPLLKFRNRVAHHEPIFSQNLSERYEAVLQVVGLLAPSLVAWVEHHSQVRQLIAQGPYQPHSRF